MKLFLEAERSRLSGEGKNHCNLHWFRATTRRSPRPLQRVVRRPRCSTWQSHSANSVLICRRSFQAICDRCQRTLPSTPQTTSSITLADSSRSSKVAVSVLDDLSNWGCRWRVCEESYPMHPVVVSSPGHCQQERGAQLPCSRSVLRKPKPRMICPPCFMKMSPSDHCGVLRRVFVFHTTHGGRS